MDCYVGELRYFAGNYAPEGWALCHGGLVSINDYQTLFSLIGTIFGGDGRTNFALPDYRGRLPVGQGYSPVTSRKYTLGVQGGEELILLEENNLPAHNHGGTVSYTNIELRASSKPAKHAAPQPGSALAVTSLVNSTLFTTLGYASTDNNPVNLGGFDANMTGSSHSGSTGDHMVQTNMMPSLGINIIIALNGIYPNFGAEE